MAKSNDLLQGTLDLLILKTVSLQPMHGYGILLRLEQLSGGALNVPQGSLYPALYRLVHRGWLDSEFGVSENNRRAKFYSLTAEGRRQLEVEERQWQRLSQGVTMVLKASRGVA
ncbi:MAG: PadR family transcriptional regulator [Acidobacteriota bacterium]